MLPNQVTSVKQRAPQKAQELVQRAPTGSRMKSIKNTDYVIYMSTKRGSTYAYLKEHDSWTQTAPTGVVRKATAEQVLNHLLPALSGDQLVSVKVERKSLYKGAGRDTGGTPKVLRERSVRWRRASVPGET